MNQKYDKIGKTLEYLIHKHFLFKRWPKCLAFMQKPLNCRLNCNNCWCAMPCGLSFSWLCCSDADWLGEQITWKIITTHFSYSFRGLKVTTTRTRQNNNNNNNNNSNNNKQTKRERWKWSFWELKMNTAQGSRASMNTTRGDFKNPWAAFRNTFLNGSSLCWS